MKLGQLIFQEGRYWSGEQKKNFEFDRSSTLKKVSKKAAEVYISFSLFFLSDQVGCMSGQTLSMAWHMTGL